MLNRPVPTDNIHTNIIRALKILITKFTIPVEVVQAEYPFQTIKMSSVIWKYIRMTCNLLLFISVMHIMYPLLMVDRKTSNCCSTKFQLLKKKKKWKERISHWSNVYRSYRESNFAVALGIQGAENIFHVHSYVWCIKIERGNVEKILYRVQS